MVLAAIALLYNYTSDYYTKKKSNSGHFVLMFWATAAN